MSNPSPSTGTTILSLLRDLGSRVDKLSAGVAVLHDRQRDNARQDAAIKGLEDNLEAVRNDVEQLKTTWQVEQAKKASRDKAIAAVVSAASAAGGGAIVKWGPALAAILGAG